MRGFAVSAISAVIAGHVTRRSGSLSQISAKLPQKEREREGARERERPRERQRETGRDREGREREREERERPRERQRDCAEERKAPGSREFPQAATKHNNIIASQINKLV